MNAGNAAQLRPSIPVRYSSDSLHVLCRLLRSLLCSGQDGTYAVAACPESARVLQPVSTEVGRGDVNALSQTHEHLPDDLPVCTSRRPPAVWDMHPLGMGPIVASESAKNNGHMHEAS